MKKAKWSLLGLLVAGLLAAAEGCRKEVFPEGEGDGAGKRGVETKDPGPTTLLTQGPLVQRGMRGAGEEVLRSGDEIMVAGRMFHTGARVVLWTDPGGYDAYRTEKRFAPWGESAYAPPGRGGGGGGEGAAQGTAAVIAKPNRYGARDAVLSWPELDQVRGGGWPLELLQQKIDQFVIHFDAVGCSRACFQTLQDDRGLSTHFMLDIDGTIYQTLDVKERAYHATTANFRAIGIEIANRGAYSSEVPLKEFYAKDAAGTLISLPARFGDGAVRVKGIYRPIRSELVRGKIGNDTLVMYDYTREQYAALAQLTATLCTVLPKITLDYPKDAKGRLITTKLADARLEQYQGLLGHYHVQENKNDPGPAFQWDLLVDSARGLMSEKALELNRAAGHSPTKMVLRGAEAATRTGR